MRSFLSPSFSMNNPNMNTPWFAVSIGLVGLIVGYAIATGMGGGPLFAGGKAPAPVPTANDPAPAPSGDPADADDDAVKGDPKATVTLIEFTDYQCPFCSRHFEQTLPSIMKDYVDTGKVKYVVRDFPLSFHGNAHKAAEAAECAGEQDKYWEMHDKLFSAQNDWANLADATAKFKEYAKGLGLKPAFDSCLDKGEMAAEVDADEAAGSAAGISGTPGFWIVNDAGDSKNISGAYPYETFKAAFDELL
jgi:protein-disulfide isomerase